MRKFIGSFCLVSIIIPFTVGCKLFDKNYEKIIHSDGSEETNKEVTIESLCEDGKEVAIIPNEWMEFCQKNESPGDVDMYNISGTEISNPESVVLRWTNKNEKKERKYVLHSISLFMTTDYSTLSIVRCLSSKNIISSPMWHRR